MKKTALLSHVPADPAILLDAIINSSQDAIIHVTSGDIINCWNPAAQRMFGYTAQEILGMSSSLLIPADLFDKKMVSMGLPYRQYTGIRKRKDGSLFDASITISDVQHTDRDTPGCLMIIKDISRDKHTLSDSKVADSHLQAIFDNAEEGFVLLDTDCVIKAFNNKARESIVLSFSTSEAKTGTSIFNYIEENRKSFFRDMIYTVLKGKSVRYDRSYKQDDGKTNWFNFSLNPVFEEGKITAICITGNNITKRKLAEQSAEENEKRFRGLVENSGDAVSILSPSGVPHYVSPSISKILGYTEQEAMGMELFSIVHPDDLPAVKKVWEEILVTPGIPFTGNICRIRHSNGSWRWIDGTITNMLHDPAINGIVDNFRDITKAIESERQLRLSEERYRYLFYSNPLPMWIYDPATLNFLEVNHAAIEKYGYTREEFLQLRLTDIRGTEDAEKLIQVVNDRKDKKYTNSGTWQHLTKKKELLHVEVSGHPVHFEGINAFLVLINDVTERNKAAHLLLKAYGEKNNILESIADGFMAVDRNWIVTYWNKEAERISGMQREDIVGKMLWDVYADAIPLKFYSEAHRALRQQVQVNYEEYFPPRGTWIDTSVYPSEEGLAIYFKDITEKKLIQENIRLTKERYEMVAKATNDAIYEWDIVSNVCYWGEGYETLFGHTWSVDKMSATSWTENLHPDEKENLFASTFKAFENRETSLTREIQFRCADGSYKIVFDKLVILYDAGGKPLKIVGAMQDITERKKNETAIEVLNKQLNRRATELVQSNEELERFAYVASHDLQEPLRMVGSFLQLLQKKYRPQLDETANQYIDFAVDGAERMKRLILDLLEYSRIGTNKDVMTNVNLSDVTHTIMKDFPPTTSGTDPVFRVALLPEIRANKMQITQLLQNLVSNALKYNTSTVAEIEIGYEENEDQWQFFVKDNGIGIEQKFLHKVFVIFQRLHNKNQFSGTGIGLAICKKIVERHGGTIWIQSEPGKGSTFYFTIKK
jgi:PAS domain S-box-containing protein